MVDTGSLSKAAEQLNHTQSAITFQMGQTERELGVFYADVGAHHKNKWLSPLMECFIHLCWEAAP